MNYFHSYIFVFECVGTFLYIFKPIDLDNVKNESI